MPEFSSINNFLSMMGSFLFCSILSVFIFSLIIDRVFIFIPRLIRYIMRKEVRVKALFVVIGQVLFWIAIIVLYYTLSYIFSPQLFYDITISFGAICGWILGMVRYAYHIVKMDAHVNPEFYERIYMTYITPHTQQDFEEFIKNLETMLESEIKEVLATNPPFLYRKAISKRLANISVDEERKKYLEEHQQSTEEQM